MRSSIQVWETQVNLQTQEPTAAWSTTAFVRDHPLLITGLGSLLIVMAVGAAFAPGMARADAVYAEFMDGCERDDKHYECTLLWRASRWGGPTVVPIPMPVPSAR